MARFITPNEHDSSRPFAAHTLHYPETTGARDGNRTHDHSLTKTVRYRCATRANLTYIMYMSGQWRIRTSEAITQLIYSQSHLATLVTAQVEEHASGF